MSDNTNTTPEEPADATGTTGATGATPPPSRTWPESNQKRNLAIIGAVVVAVAGITWWSVATGGGSSGAATECRERVEARLKAPSTADFQSSSTRELGSTGDRWEVTGVVDAENSFGGTVRLTYKCDLTYDDTADSWDAALVDVRE